MFAPHNKNELWFLAQTLEHFRLFVPRDVSKRLVDAGITLEGPQVTSLITGLKSFEMMHTELYATKEVVTSEQRIADLADELATLIQASRFTKDGWRYVWGNAFAEEEKPDCQDALDVADFLNQLRIIKASAIEAVDALQAGLTSDIRPGSNRANPLRYFYWLLLLAFWKNDLRREIKMSNDETRGPRGDLVSFIQALSAGGISAGVLTEAELSGGAVRQFIRRNVDQVERVVVHFQI